jgi:hypothetical protein
MRIALGIVVAASAFALASWGTGAQAASSLEGAWNGTGTVTYKGSTDQVRCRVRYTKAGGASYTYTSTCATENGRYELVGKLSSSGGNRYTGSVESTSHKGAGRVLLIHNGGSLSVTVTSGIGTAKLSLRR